MPQQQTSHPTIFVGIDNARGTGLVMRSLDGDREAAASIAQMLAQTAVREAVIV